MKYKEYIYKGNKSYLDRFDYYVEEVKNIDEESLSSNDRYLAIVATLIATDGSLLFEDMLSDILEHVSPYKVREVIYQASAYLGISKAYPFIEILSKLNLNDKGLITTKENRREEGSIKQVEIFGASMKDFYLQGKVNYLLASNCFGDYYTREGLTTKERELVTFCYLIALGGVEPQVIAHIKGNINVGNGLDYLTKVVHQVIPYIGYPRSLNALSCLKKVKEEYEMETK